MSALTEEEQLERLKSVTKKYGSAAVSAVLVVLIAFFGWQYWHNKNVTEAQNQTARLQQFMDQAATAKGNPDAYNAVAEAADKMVKTDPDSVQAMQAQLTMAKLAYDQEDYAGAERELRKVQNSKIKDQGLLAIAHIALADALSAQGKFDDALALLAEIKVPEFQSTVDEARGDIFVAKKDIENAKKSYQSAWDRLVAAKQERQILQIKLESVGVLVEDPELERPILQSQVDES